MASSKSGLMGNYDLFVFDWDGTLNRMRFLLGANESIKRALHIWNEDSSIKDFKRTNHDLKKRINSIEVRNDVAAFLFEIFMEFGKPRLHHDVLRTIERLKRNGKKTAIFSNSSEYRLVKELKRLGLIGYFDMIVSAKELNAVKPNPTGLRYILSATKTKQDRCIYFGDMADDILTAKLAHVHSCAVADGFDSYHKLKSMHPEYIFTSIEELYKSL
jgi:phosphoglycolate phosphatase